MKEEIKEFTSKSQKEILVEISDKVRNIDSIKYQIDLLSNKIDRIEKPQNTFRIFPESPKGKAELIPGIDKSKVRRNLGFEDFK